MTVFSWCKSASLHQLPGACTSLPWLQTGLHMQGRYWSGEEHWQFVSYHSDDPTTNYLGISWAHTQLRSGAGTLPHQPSFLFSGNFLKECDWQRWTGAAWPATEKASPSHTALSAAQFPVAAPSLSQTLVWVRDLPRGHLWLVSMMKDGFLKIIPDFPQPKQELTQSYRFCLISPKPFESMFLPSWIFIFP